MAVDGSTSLEILRYTQDDIVSEPTYPAKKITKSQNHKITRGLKGCTMLYYPWEVSFVMHHYHTTLMKNRVVGFL